MKKHTRILLLNENDVFTKLYTRYFNSLGIKNFVSNSIKEQDIINKIKKVAPDIIIIDTEFFNDSGVSITRSISSLEDYNDIPIIYLVHPSHRKDLISILKNTLSDYVYKPIQIDELYDRMRMILKIRDRFDKKMKKNKSEYLKSTGAMLYHQINQPLSVILLSTELLYARGIDKFAKKDIVNIKRIKYAVESIKDILHDLTMDKREDDKKENIDTRTFTIPKSILKRKILVIDDNKGIRDVVSEILTDEGAEVFVAKNIKEASQIIDKNYAKLDAVFCDIFLKKETGVQIFHKIRKLNSKIIFIFMTGYSLDREMKSFIKDFNIRLLTKPFTKRKILLSLGIKKEKKKKK